MKITERRILITGGAGFIGSYIVDELIKRKNELIVLDNLSSSDIKNIRTHLSKDNFKFVKGDIRNFDLLNSLLKDVDVVFHYAANPDVRLSVERPEIDFEINVKGTFNVLEAMRLNDVKNMVFASSGGTLYGEASVIPTPENYPPRPISVYGASKAACEAYISAYCGFYGLNAISLRYANIIGPRSNHGVIYDFFMKLKRNPHELEILGNGRQKKSYLYISDCVKASILAVERHQEGFDVFNVGSDDWITVNEIAKIVIERLGLKNVKIKYTGGDRGWPGDVPLMLLDISRIKALGWKPEVPIREGIALYVDWLKKEYRYGL